MEQTRGLAANVIPVVELCQKVVSLCGKYYLADKDAKSDIQRLQGEVNCLKDTLGEIQRCIEGLDWAKFSGSRLLEALNDCFEQLNALDARLQPGRVRKALSRVGVRAWRWSLGSREVERIINELERCRQNVSAPLQPDQT
jgi:hypothetical protein